jgi:hypothetical protein
MTRTANSKRIIGWADKGIKYKRIIRWRPTGQNKLWWHLMAKLWKEYLRPAFPTKTTLMLEGLRYILTFSFSPPPTHCLIYLFYSHSLPPSLTHSVFVAVERGYCKLYWRQSVGIFHSSSECVSFCSTLTTTSLPYSCRLWVASEDSCLPRRIF